jgi:hypothetical protein
MNPLLTRRLWMTAWACSLVMGGKAPAQDVAIEPWRPYRNTGVVAAPPVGGPVSTEFPTASAAGAAPTAGVAQAPMGEAVLFPEPIFAAPELELPFYVDAETGPPTSPEFWHWRLLPEGVIWQSYWAGAHEPRISGVPFHDDSSHANLLDVTLGGRASLVRYGAEGLGRPQGAELQIEGAAFPRLNLDENWDVDAVDFRFGLPLVYGRDQWQTKFSYYHLSSHMGDELAIREDALDNRINFSRDALVLGLSYFPLPAWRWYAEAGWAFHYDESQPWEFQFGVDVAEPGPTGPWGTPYFAVNGHIREELDYGGNVVAQLGWLWRGASSRTLRTGFHYFNGKTNQFEFFDHFEEQIGGGVWYDF